MDEVSNRLREFADYKRLNLTDVERDAKLSNGMAGKLSNKSRESTFNRIANAYPELNMVWLKTGAGSMLNSSNSLNEAGANSQTREAYGSHQQTEKSPAPATDHINAQLIDMLRTELNEKNTQIKNLLDILAMCHK